MSITYEQLKAVNDAINKIPVKGKEYAQVNDRVKAFRQLCPEGSIETDIIAMENGVVTMKAIVKDENGNILGTGLAQEKESSSYINKTSFIENCETSAVGRALGFAGIGVDGSMASAEEIANAILNQESDNSRKTQKKESKKQEEPSKEVKEMLTDEAIANVDKNLIPNGGKVTEKQLEMLHAELERTGINPKTVLAMFKVNDFSEMSDAQAVSCLNKFHNTPDKKA